MMWDRTLADVEKEIDTLVKNNKKRNTIAEVFLSFIKASPIFLVSIATVTISTLVYQKTYNLDPQLFWIPLIILIVLGVLDVIFWLAVSALNRKIADDDAKKLKDDSELRERTTRAKAIFERKMTSFETRPGYLTISFNETYFGERTDYRPIAESVGIRMADDMRQIDNGLVDRMNEVVELANRYYGKLLSFTLIAEQDITKIEMPETIEEPAPELEIDPPRDNRISTKLEALLLQPEEPEVDPEELYDITALERAKSIPTMTKIKILFLAYLDKSIFRTTYVSDLANYNDGERDFLYSIRNNHNYSDLLSDKELENLILEIEELRRELEIKNNSIIDDVQYQFSRIQYP